MENFVPGPMPVVTAVCKEYGLVERLVKTSLKERDANLFDRVRIELIGETTGDIGCSESFVIPKM